MTTASFEHIGYGFEATISGHAGQNPGGPDIVCAACSILAYTMLESILAIEEKGGLEEFSSSMDEEAGHYHIKLLARSWAHDEVEKIIDTISVGFALLQHKYPANVSLCMRSGEK